MTIADDLPHRMGATFEAKLDSNCKGCSMAIYEGDLMGYVDDVAVCDGCYNDAELDNSVFVRELALKQREADRAADPERYDRMAAAAKKIVDGAKAAGEERRATEEWDAKVRAAAEREPGKEWVTSPAGTGYVKVPTEPQQEETMAIEPGIQALMAAGLLQGQEPGGSGVCPVTITDGAGTVTEVEIPVPVDPPTAAKTRAPRRSRAKAAVPSTGSVEDAAEVLAAAVEADKAEDARLMREVEDGAIARMAQLEANAATWDPDAIAAQVKADALQAGLQSAVDSGAMAPDQAAALGWVAPGVYEAPWLAVSTNYQQVHVDLSPPQYPPGLPEAYGDAVLEATARAMSGPQPTDGPDYHAEKAFYDAHNRSSGDIFLDALSAARSVAEEDAILAALDELPAYEGGGTHNSIKADLLGVIVEAINYHPRSLQKRIGPSEIGTECDHCLAAKLAGWEQVERGEAWLPTVGTAVHSWIEGAFGRHHLGPNGTRRYLTETRVPVGEIDGEEITGSCDLADVVAGWTWDWKIVGPTTLKSAKTGPSRQYVVQQHLYARGWNRLGVKITHVGIAYLPRNAMSVKQGVWWSEPYNEQIAIDALARADQMSKNLRAMDSISREVRDKYITGLDRWRTWKAEVNGVEKLVTGNSQEGRIVCMDCPRYADYPADAGEALKQLDGLLV